MLSKPKPYAFASAKAALHAAASPELSRILTDIRLAQSQSNDIVFDQTLAYSETNARSTSGQGADGSDFVHLALVQDPVDRIFNAWRYLANTPQFEAEGSAGKLKAARLPLDPDFAQFMAQYQRYLKLSPGLKTALKPVSNCIGRKLSRFDKVYPCEKLAELRTVLFERAGIDTAGLQDWSPREPRPILREATVQALEKATRADYKFLNEFYAFDRSPLLTRAFRPGTIDLNAIPVLTAPTAAPNPELRLAALVNETPEITRAFVEHHRKIGVGKLHLFLDDPDDPMADELEGDPFVDLTRCVDDFWPNAKRPWSIEGRQGICYTRTYNQYETGWLICCDADELIYANEDLSAVLDRTGPSQWVVRAKVSEAIWQDGDDITIPFGASHIRWILKPPQWPRVRRSIYGPANDLLSKNLTAQKYGKYIVRCGLKPERLAVHRPIFAEELSEETLGFDKDNRTFVYLVHHDARSFDDWCRKLDQRLQPRHGFVAQGDLRDQQVKAFAEARDEGRLEELFRQLYVLDEDNLRLLACCDAVARIGTDASVAQR